MCYTFTTECGNHKEYPNTNCSILLQGIVGYHKKV